MQRHISHILIAIAIASGSTWVGMTAQKMFGKATQLNVAAAAVTAEKESRAGGPVSQNSKKIKYWVAPMDPTYIRNEPGKSPMGMDLVPVYEESGEASEPASTIRVDANTIQNMGVRTTQVTRRPLKKTIRTFGTVTYDETRRYAVNTKFNGWIEKLHVTFEGEQVTKGQPLFDIYSPELVTAQEEYLLALRHDRALTESPYERVRDNAARLLQASLTRLKYWDFTDKQIEALKDTGRMSKTITVHAPAGGVVVKKTAVEGHFVKAGENQFEFADLARVWVDVDIYEYELPWVKNGMSATMDLAYIPGKRFNGNVLFIYPYLTSKTRTARLRLEFPNPGNRLKPAMYANINLEAQLEGNQLVIPQEAVIDSGLRKVVFVAKGKGRFEPRDIAVGVEVNDAEVHVLEGLAEGEEIVISAQFMLDSESRLREAVQKMLAAATPGDDDLDMRAMTMDAADDDLDMSGLTMEAPRPRK